MQNINELGCDSEASTAVQSLAKTKQWKWLGNHQKTQSLCDNREKQHLNNVEKRGIPGSRRSTKCDQGRLSIWHTNI